MHFPEVNDFCKSINKTNHHKAYEKKKLKDWDKFKAYAGKGLDFTAADLKSYFEKLKSEHQ